MENSSAHLKKSISGHHGVVLCMVLSGIIEKEGG